MALTRRIALCIGVTLALTARAASAQTVVAGAALARDVQRFPGDAGQNRLDGTAGGATLIAGVTLSHIAVRIERSWTGSIVSEQTFSIDTDERKATIQSTFEHTMRATNFLGGFQHAVGSRFHLTYLGGVAFTHVERTFTTTASDVVLVPPSSSSASTTAVADDVAALTMGADAIIRVASHVGLIAGIRWQRLPLSGGVSGSSTRPLVGAAWTF